MIAQLQPIAVLFTIPEDQLQPVLGEASPRRQIARRCLDRDETKKLSDGTLLTVDNQIDLTTGTSKLKAVFSND